MAHIAVVDDKEILRESLERALGREDHIVTTFASAPDALVAMKQQSFDVILTDLKMPQMDGLAFIQEVRAAGCDAPIIMMTAFATVATAVEAMKLGAFDYIQKPFEAETVAVLIERAIEHSRLQRENEALRASMMDGGATRQLVGSGPAMRDLRGKLDRIAASHATVLVCGESGTGKELVAGYLYEKSPRADRPMLRLNCAALSANLLESELFGHEKGAFTGADRIRKGRFELAHGGTLLLDEISELALPLQAKLLRVLQEGEFERVGSSTTRRADVRVVATTNRDLDDYVAKRRFRQDLYYRLNVLPVHVPPLRDRLDDLPDLVDHFIERARITGARGRSFSAKAMRLLSEYSWPGNVRELENICCRAATLSASETVEPELIEPWVRPTVSPTTGLGPLREGRMLEDAERVLIEKMLQKFDGHRAKTAKALGMGVRTLGMKLKQWREEAAAVGRTAEMSRSTVLAGSNGR